MLKSEIQKLNKERLSVSAVLDQSMKTEQEN